VAESCEEASDEAETEVGVKRMMTGRS